MGQTPPHGLLKYSDALFEVDFTRDLRAELLAVMAELRANRLSKSVPRSHTQAGKCQACGFVSMCDEALG
jgi:CRISPR-associated exonuclease Cas4